MSAILLLLPRADARQKIAERIDSGQALLNEPIQGEADLTRLRRDRERWHSYNLELLRRMFDTDGPLTEYNPKRGGIVFAPETFYQQIESFHRAVETNLNRLRSIVEKLELYEEASSVTPNPALDPPSGRDVFIVHGHAGREYEVAHVVPQPILGDRLRPVPITGFPGPVDQRRCVMSALLVGYARVSADQQDLTSQRD